MPLPIIASAVSRQASRLFARINAYLRLVDQIRRERRTLRTLDDRLLRDIGVTRDAAEREAARDPWDLPEARKPRPDRVGQDNQRRAPNFLLTIRPGS